MCPILPNYIIIVLLILLKTKQSGTQVKRLIVFTILRSTLYVVFQWNTALINPWNIHKNERHVIPDESEHSACLES